PPDAAELVRLCDAAARRDRLVELELSAADSPRDARRVRRRRPARAARERAHARNTHSAREARGRRARRAPAAVGRAGACRAEDRAIRRLGLGGIAMRGHWFVSLVALAVAV